MRTYISEDAIAIASFREAISNLKAPVSSQETILGWAALRS